MTGTDGKYVFGAVKVGERGQIVIPKEAREVFGIKPGDLMLILGDVKQGIAMVKLDIIPDIANDIFSELRGTLPTKKGDDSE